jgi:hypothetical protein
MIFSLILLLISVGMVVYEDRRMSAIREELESIRRDITLKGDLLRADHPESMALRAFVRSLCQSANRIAERAASDRERLNCD